MATPDNKMRVGLCKHHNRQVLQTRDSGSNDAPDEAGWMCLHDETREQEQDAIRLFEQEQAAAKVDRWFDPQPDNL